MPLFQLVTRRFLLAIPTVIGVCTVVFFLSHLIPGDPVDYILQDQTNPIDRLQLQKELGLDKPIVAQYIHYFNNLLHGDLGKSYYSHGRTVLNLILERLPYTLILAISSMMCALLFSIPLGIFAALKAFSWKDTSVMFIALLGISIPNFALGPALIVIFVLLIGLDIPVSGFVAGSSLILPTLTLGTSLMALLTRMTRTSFMEVLKQDYVRTAYAKGLQERSILFKHCLRNALNPVATIAGLQFGTLLTGSIITEKIFDWPGLGSLFISSIQSRDFLVVQGCILVIAIIYIFINLLTDIGYSILDPRISIR
ncbi:MAG: ABC transporter permease [Deltaproteobacteria bacterium]|nr:ABC transporter permease [Deltaproteobacteria bacterium]